MSIDEYSPEKIDKNSISDWESVECLFNANKLARLEYFEELEEESLELEIIKNGLFVGFEKNKGEIGVQQELLQFSYVEFNIVVLDFKAQNQILEVESSDVGMGVIEEDL